MNTKRNELGQFVSQLEPLVWVRAEEVKEADEVVQVSEVKAGSESDDLAQHNPPSLTFTVGDEEVVVIGRPKKLDRHGLPRMCSRCKAVELVESEGNGSYCKDCWAEYQRERYAARGR